VVAVGYANGLVLLVRIEDGAEILARKGTGAPIAALAWSAAGSALVFGAEDGEVGVIDLG
jgi:Anaphase-promoting complex subunit 4 WD40 domain